MYLNWLFLTCWIFVWKIEHILALSIISGQSGVAYIWSLFQWKMRIRYFYKVIVMAADDEVLDVTIRRQEPRHQQFLHWPSSSGIFRLYYQQVWILPLLSYDHTHAIITQIMKTEICCHAHFPAAGDKVCMRNFNRIDRQGRWRLKTKCPPSNTIIHKSVIRKLNCIYKYDASESVRRRLAEIRWHLMSYTNYLSSWTRLQ